MNQPVHPLILQAQWFQAVMAGIMIVWAGTFVLSQVVKVVKGEEVEKPPIIGG